MERIKANIVFFSIMMLLGIALMGSVGWWYMQRGDLAEAQKSEQAKRNELDKLQRSGPTQDHVDLLVGVREDIDETYKDILKTYSSWNDYSTEALGTVDILAHIRGDIGYKGAEDSLIRKWIDDKKLKAFEAPDGRFYVLRADMEDFLSEVRKSKPGDYFEEEFIDDAREASTKFHITETPTLFLGNLQTLQREIKTFARAKGVTLDKQALLLSFPNLLTRSEPPKTELLPLVKQRSAMRDIMYLLMESGVFEIKNIVMTSAGPQDIMKTDFFTARDFEVTFVATYPAIARFMNMLLDPRKELVTVKRGVKEALPRNFFVVTDILYKSEEAEIERERQQEYESRKRQLESATKQPGSTTNPYSMGRADPRSSRTYPGYGSLYASRGGKKLSEFAKYHMKMAEREARTKDKPGRRPKHNVLKVIMTISFVDLAGEITGETVQGKKAATGPGMY